VNFRPARFTGVAVGGGVAAVAVLLAAVLLAFAIGWDISTAKFLAFVGVFALLAVAALFGYWTYALLTLGYDLNQEGLTIRWGLVRQFVPLAGIQRFVPGREMRLPQVQGVNWWGCHVGRGAVEGLGQTLFYSTHRSPWEAIYIITPGIAYAVSPENHVRFSMELQHLMRETSPDESGSARPRAAYPALAVHPFWLDRYGQLLALAAVAANVALFGFICGVYPGLADKLNLAFPPVGAIDLRAKDELFQIPLTALAVLAVSLAAALAVHKWERAASHLLLGGALFTQGVFWVAAAIAVT
jgi:hypothetical protein